MNSDTFDHATNVVAAIGYPGSMRVSIEHESKLTELRPRDGEPASEFARRVAVVIQLLLDERMPPTEDTKAASEHE